MPAMVLRIDHSWRARRRRSCPRAPRRAASRRRRRSRPATSPRSRTSASRCTVDGHGFTPLAPVDVYVDDMLQTPDRHAAAAGRRQRRRRRAARPGALPRDGEQRVHAALTERGNAGDTRSRPVELRHAARRQADRRSRRATGAPGALQGPRLHGAAAPSTRTTSSTGGRARPSGSASRRAPAARSRSEPRSSRSRSGRRSALLDDPVRPAAPTTARRPPAARAADRSGSARDQPELITGSARARRVRSNRRSPLVGVDRRSWSPARELALQQAAAPAGRPARLEITRLSGRAPYAGS